MGATEELKVEAGLQEGPALSIFLVTMVTDRISVNYNVCVILILSFVAEVGCRFRT